MVALPGHGHRLRFDDPQGPPRLVDADGVSDLPGDLPGEVVSADGGGLRVLLPGDGEWTLDADRAVRGYQRAAGSGPDPAQRLSQQLSAWSRPPGEPAPEDWRNSLETIKNAHGITTQPEVARILDIAHRTMANQMNNPASFLRWRVRIAAFLASQDIRNWRIETASARRFFRVVFGMGTTLVFREGKVVGWRVDLPGSALQVSYDEGGSVRLAARDGGEPPDGWNLRSEVDGSVTVGQIRADGGIDPRWWLSAGRTLDPPVPHPEAVPALESFTLPPAGPADPGAFARLTQAGALDHRALQGEPDLAEATAITPASTFPDVPGDSAGPSAPDRPAPPAAADMSDGDRIEQSTRELLTRLNGHRRELARRLLTSDASQRMLLAGVGNRGVWLPRLSVLEKIAAVEADWRLESASDEGFAVAVRQGGSIAHFRPDGTFSRWVVALPGHGHRLRFDDPQGPPRLVDADGVSDLPGDLPGEVVSADGGGLRVLLPGDGEWTLDADRAVRGYQRAAGSGPDPAQRLSQQLSAWSRNPWSRTPGEPAPEDWQNSLETIKNAPGITRRHDMARILGIPHVKLADLEKNPTSGFQWRVRIAAYLVSQDIRNWRIETASGTRFFHVVFGTGTTLKFLGGQVVGWRVDLPGSALQVRYDEGCSVRLVTRDGGKPPDGWELRSEVVGRVTVVQVPADGGPGSQWRVSAGRTLESFTLPAGPADPSVFARLTRAGVLDHQAPPTEPVPAGAVPMALESDLPDRGFPGLEMPDTVAEDGAGLSYLDTLNWADT